MYIKINEAISGQEVFINSDHVSIVRRRVERQVEGYMIVFSSGAQVFASMASGQQVVNALLNGGPHSGKKR